MASDTSPSVVDEAVRMHLNASLRRSDRHAETRTPKTYGRSAIGGSHAEAVRERRDRVLGEVDAFLETLDGLLLESNLSR